MLLSREGIGPTKEATPSACPKGTAKVEGTLSAGFQPATRTAAEDPQRPRMLRVARKSGQKCMAVLDPIQSAICRD